MDVLIRLMLATAHREIFGSPMGQSSLNMDLTRPGFQVIRVNCQSKLNLSFINIADKWDKTRLRVN